MFPCTKCGVCCQNISHIPELKGYDIGNGICKHLDIISNKCDIYETRPNICKIDGMYELSYNKYLTKHEFYLMNAEACNLLQSQNKISLEYKVKIGE